MTSKRPQKTIKLNYWSEDKTLSPYIQISGRPGEAKLAANQKTFVSARDSGITLSPGPGNSICLQGMSHNLKYGGLLMDLPFPMALIPITPFTPYPTQMFSPPLLPIVPIIAQLSVISSSFVGV